MAVQSGGRSDYRAVGCRGCRTPQQRPAPLCWLGSCARQPIGRACRRRHGQTAGRGARTLRPCWLPAQPRPPPPTRRLCTRALRGTPCWFQALIAARSRSFRAGRGAPPSSCHDPSRSRCSPGPARFRCIREGRSATSPDHHRGSCSLACPSPAVPATPTAVHPAQRPPASDRSATHQGNVASGDQHPRRPPTWSLERLTWHSRSASWSPSRGPRSGTSPRPGHSSVTPVSGRSLRRMFAEPQVGSALSTAAENHAWLKRQMNRLLVP